MEKYPVIKTLNGQRYFYRFSRNQRLQHIVLALSVIVLVLTGMPLKFSNTSWAPYLYKLFGGINAAPIVHRVAGSILLILFMYHIIYLVYIIYKYQVVPLKIKEGRLTAGMILKLLANQPLVPNMNDVRDIKDLFKYLLFITNKRPEGGLFTWKEKFDYWAPFWGMVVIGLSGLIMWNKVVATKIVPGIVINFSIIAHSDEALLAALFLFIWHWYNVHFSISVFPMGMAYITGYLPEELMIEEHYEYYVEVMKKAGLEKEIRPPHGSHSEVTFDEAGQ